MHGAAMRRMNPRSPTSPAGRQSGITSYFVVILISQPQETARPSLVLCRGAQLRLAVYRGEYSPVRKRELIVNQCAYRRLIFHKDKDALIGNEQLLSENVSVFIRVVLPRELLAGRHFIMNRSTACHCLRQSCDQRVPALLRMSSKPRGFQGVPNRSCREKILLQGCVGCPPLGLRNP